MKENTRRVVYAGITIEYQLERKPVKNLNLRVRPDGGVYVSANPRVPLRAVDAFVLREARFVLRAREKQAAQTEPQAPCRYQSGESFRFLGREQKIELAQAATRAEEGVWPDCPEPGRCRLAVCDPAEQSRREKVFDNWWRQQCLIIFDEILARLYPLLQKKGVACPRLKIRKMKARWGSCLTQSGVIILNTRLLASPVECIEYVVLHELCHFVCPNHSPAFYELVASFMPDWQQRRAALNSPPPPG